MDDLNALLTPGMLVRHPAQPGWGIGQVQSNIAGKVTVNFRDEGKVVIDSFRVGLTAVFENNANPYGHRITLLLPLYATYWDIAPPIFPILGQIVVM